METLTTRIYASEVEGRKKGDRMQMRWRDGMELYVHESAITCDEGLLLNRAWGNWRQFIRRH